MAIKIEDTFNPISSGAGILSSIIGAISARKQMKASIRAQQEENQKTRQYNLMLAQLQNQWNIDQWNRENAYNDPTAMMQRYANAGLNKNLIYSQGNLSAASPEMTSGAPAESADMSGLGIMPTIGDAALRGFDTALKAAQIRNIDADTEKKKNEAEGQTYTNEILKSDAAFRNEWNRSQLDLNGVKIDCEKSMKDFYDAKAGEARVSTDNLVETGNKIKEETAKLRAEIAVLDEEKKIKALEAIFKDKTFDLEVQNLVSKTNLNYAEAKAALMNATTNSLVGAATATKFRAETRLTDAQWIQADIITQGYRIQNDAAQWQLKLDKRYGDAKAIVGMATDVVDSAARLCSGIGSITSIASVNSPTSSGTYHRTLYDANGNPMYNYSEKR